MDLRNGHGQTLGGHPWGEIPSAVERTPTQLCAPVLETTGATKYADFCFVRHASTCVQEFNCTISTPMVSLSTFEGFKKS